MYLRLLTTESSIKSDSENILEKHRQQLLNTASDSGSIVSFCKRQACMWRWVSTRANKQPLTKASDTMTYATLLASTVSDDLDLQQQRHDLNAVAGNGQAQGRLGMVLFTATGSNTHARRQPLCDDARHTDCDARSAG